MSSTIAPQQVVLAGRARPAGRGPRGWTLVASITVSRPAAQPLGGDELCSTSNASSVAAWSFGSSATIAAAGVGGDHLGRQEVLRRERRLAGAARADQHDEAGDRASSIVIARTPPSGSAGRARRPPGRPGRSGRRSRAGGDAAPPRPGTRRGVHSKRWSRWRSAPAGSIREQGVVLAVRGGHDDVRGRALRTAALEGGAAAAGRGARSPPPPRRRRSRRGAGRGRSAPCMQATRSRWRGGSRSRRSRRAAISSARCGDVDADDLGELPSRSSAEQLALCRSRGRARRRAPQASSTAATAPSRCSLSRYRALDRLLLGLGALGGARLVERGSARALHQRARSVLAGSGATISSRSGWSASQPSPRRSSFSTSARRPSSASRRRAPGSARTGGRAGRRAGRRPRASTTK